MSPQQMAGLVRVALGEAPADTIVVDGTLANVYTGELQEHCSIAIKGDRIAWLGRDYRHLIGEDTRLLHAPGKVIIPGFIDGHTHIFNRYGIDEFLRHAIPSGTTSIVTEVLEFAELLGVPAVGQLLEMFSGRPIRIFTTLPAMSMNDPLWPGIAVQPDAYATYLRNDSVIGIGEGYWSNVLYDNGHLFEAYEQVQSLGKAIDGHSAGARGNKLQAFIATGQTSCHEPISVDEIVERLRLGLHVLLRQGSTRADLDTTLAVKNAGVSLRRLALVSDSADPFELLSGNYMNAIVQKCIDFGFDPVTAIQMATLNIAEHFHLDYWLGGLAPGKMADLCVLPALTRIEPECVLSEGRVTFQEGQIRVPLREARYPAAFCESIYLRPEFASQDFVVLAPDRGDQCSVRAISQITDLVTQEALYELPVERGEIQVDTGHDVVKVAAIERRKGLGERFVGFVHGHGLKAGAIASTMTWDSTSLVVLGVDDGDMAAAVNHVVQKQGGAAVFANGKLLADFVAPIAGLVSGAALTEITASLTAVQTAAESIGCRHGRELLAIETLTTAAIPHFRINHAGYFSIRERRSKPLFP